jgi:proline iminopeptidase
MRRWLLVGMAMVGLLAHGQTVQGTFENAGLVLHYTAVGTGAPVVILSGGPGMDVDYMRPVAEMVVATHHMAILLEQRGTGRSMPSVLSAQTVSGELMLADVEALRVKLGVAQVTVLGHSAGTITALSYAIAHPTAVTALILMGAMPPAFVEIDHADDNLMVRMSPETKLKLGAAMGVVGAMTPQEKAERMIEGLRLVMAADFFDEDQAEKFVATMTVHNFHEDTMQVLESSPDAKYDLRANLAKLKVPVLIVQGRQDPYDPELAGETKAAIPDARMVIVEKAGHFGWLEQPAVYEKALTGFLK